MKILLIIFLLVGAYTPAVGQRVKKCHRDIVSAAELMHHAYEDEGREIIDSLLRVNPNNSDALFLRSLDYWHYGKTSQAIECCTRTIDTHSKRCYYDLGYVYYRRGDMHSCIYNYDDAIEDYSIALKLINKRDNIHRCYILYNRALCYYEKCEYATAEQDLLKALDCGYNTLNDDILELIELIHQKETK